MPSLAPVDFRLVSGRAVEVDVHGLAFVAQAREKVGVALGHSPGSIRLVNSSGRQPTDPEYVEVLYNGVTTVVIDNSRQEELEASFVSARDVQDMAALVEKPVLQLENQKLETLPDTICQLVALEELYVCSNQLMTLPNSLSRLSKLRILILSGNNLIDLPSNISQLTSLHVLQLTSNRLTSLPDAPGLPPGLRVLHVNSNRLLALPSSINSLSKLRVLHLSGNQLTELPESIAELVELRELYLNYNQLAHLPNSLTRLTKLEVLHFVGNIFSPSPANFAKLTNLRQLHLKAGTQPFNPDFGRSRPEDAKPPTSVPVPSVPNLAQADVGGVSAEVSYWSWLLGPASSCSQLVNVRL